MSGRRAPDGQDERGGGRCPGAPLSGTEFVAIAEHAGDAYLRYAFTRGTAQEVAFLWDVLGLVPGMRVLDLGCGPGRHLDALRRRGAEPVGLDRSRAFLGATSGQRVHGDARALPFAAASFDAAICLCQGGFGLLGGDGDLVALRELAAVLAPGAPLALSAFSSYFLLRHWEDGDRFDASSGVAHEVSVVRDAAGTSRSFDLWTTCFTPRELRLMATAVGLVPEALWSVGPGDYAARPPDLDHPEWLLLARAGRPPPDAGMGQRGRV